MSTATTTSSRSAGGYRWVIKASLALFAGKSQPQDDLTFAVIRFATEAVQIQHDPAKLDESFSTV